MSSWFRRFSTDHVTVPCSSSSSIPPSASPTPPAISKEHARRLFPSWGEAVRRFSLPGASHQSAADHHKVATTPPASSAAGSLPDLIDEVLFSEYSLFVDVILLLNACVFEVGTEVEL